MVELALKCKIFFCQAWSPLIVGLDNAAVVREAGDKQSGGPLDPSVS